MAEYERDRRLGLPAGVAFNRVNATENFSTAHVRALGCFSSYDYYAPYTIYRLVIEVGIVGTLCLFGFVGCSLTIVILRMDKDKNNTTTWLLQVLALVDMLYLSACVFIQPVKTIYTIFYWYPDKGFHHVYLYLEYGAWFVASVIQTVTIWVVILVTTDRYLAICRPLSCRKLRTVRNCRIAAGVAVVVAVLYNIPQVYDRKVIFAKDSCNKSISKTLLTDLRHDPLYFLLYKTLCYMAFRSFGPLLTLVVLNARLMVALRLMRLRRRSLTARALGGAAAASAASSANGENLTLMLVVVVTVFVVCELPDCCLRLANSLIPYVHWDWLQLDEDSVAYANVFTNMLHAFNSSFNFLVYCLVGRKFRRILAGLFFRGGGGGGGGKTSADRSVKEDEVDLRLTTMTNQTATGGESATPQRSDSVRTRAACT